MGYVEVEGDLLAMGLPAIGHGCNTSGSMAGGIARQVRATWPDMYAAYARRCHRGGFELGDIFAWEADGVIVYNLATQVRPGPDARLDAILDSVARALDDVNARGLPQLGIPRIGAGIGGLDWVDVQATLKDLANGHQVQLVVARRPRISGGPANQRQNARVSTDE